MKVVVDRDRCTGIGMCESLAPDIFEVDDEGELTLLIEDVTEDQVSDAREACASCPTEALTLES